jgi:hypothetical protein
LVAINITQQSVTVTTQQEGAMSQRWLQAVMLLLALMILLTGCAPAAPPTPGPVPVSSNPSDALVGQWRLTGQRSAQLAVKFFAGDAVIWTQEGRNFSGTYQLKQDDLIELTVSGDLGVVKMLLTEVTLNGDTLSFKINDNNPRLEFERAKQ